MYKQIVVGTDGSERAGVAIDAAIELARLTGATLHVVHAHHVLSAYQVASAAEVGAVSIDVEGTNRAASAEAQRICDEVVERAAGAGVHAEAHCVAGDAGDALIRVAQDADADVIVVGNRGMTGKRRFVLGSVPNKVSHHCPVSLLIVDTSDARG